MMTSPFIMPDDLSPKEQLRQRFLQVSVVFVLLSVAIMGIIWVTDIDRDVISGNILLGTFVIFTLALVLLNYRRFAGAITTVCVISFSVAMLQAPSMAAYVGLLFVSLIIAAVFDRAIVHVLVVILGFARVIWLISHMGALDSPLLDGIAPFVVVMIAIAISVLLRYVSNYLENVTNEAVRNRRLIDANAEISTLVSQELEVDALLQQGCERILEQFNLYHVRVFLVDDGGDEVILKAATGTPGQTMLADKYRVAVGSQTVVGLVARVGDPVIMNDARSDSLYEANELLPGTRSELVLPLMDLEKVTGVLDLHSIKPNAFGAVDLQMMQVIRNQLANALRNARLYEKQRQNAIQNQQLAEQSRQALKQVQRLNERLTGRGWIEYLQRQREISGVDIDFNTDQVVSSGEWTSTLEAAIDRADTVQQQGTDGAIIAVPLRVRGQVVGAMEFELEAGKELTDEDRVLIADIEERFGYAIDNIRLLQDTRRGQQREALINTLSNRLQASNNVEVTLKEVAQSLQQTLNASRVSIRLGTTA